MRTVMCLVFWSVWAFNSVFSVCGIRVPMNWNVENGPGYVNHRSSRRNDEHGGFAVESFRASDFANNVPGARNIPMLPQANSQMILGPNGLYILPQSNDYQQESFSSLQAPEISEALKSHLDNRYQSESRPAQSYLPHYKKYKQIPDNVLGVQPLGVVDKYQQLKEAQKMQELVNKLMRQYNPELFKYYPEAPPSQSLEDLKPWALSRHVPQTHQLIVSASEEGATLNPLGFKQKLDRSTKKEPVFVVTEGYRNVLLQGPHHKIKYLEGNQEREESNDVPNKEKLESDEKPPQKRKVTKIYRIHNSLGGNHKNLVEADEVKPVRARYFQRPKIYNDEDRRLGLDKHLRTNYRDDTLHEPIYNKNYEKGNDDEDERVLSEDEVDDENDKTLINEVVEPPRDGSITIKEERANLTANGHDESKEGKSESNVEITKSVDETVKMEEAKDIENEEENVEDEDDEELDETDENNQVPRSEHVDPKPPPTKPIYPGEGAWANPELKHRPHISQHRFLKPAQEEQKPDGYNVFEDLEQYFERQKDDFGNKFTHEETTTVANFPLYNYFESIRTPNPVNPIPVYDPFTKSSSKNNAETPKETINNTEDNDNSDASSREPTEIHEDIHSENSAEENEELEENDEDTDEDADEFVPLKLYTQVRMHENVVHAPYDPLEHGRLREVIKDSKVQTVYTEEGYEDAAYDHAGHEKNAEKDQGYSEFEREKVGQGKTSAPDSNEGPSKQVSVLDDFEHALMDSLASDSIIPKENATQNSDNKKSEKNNFITSQQVKTTQVKNKPGGNMELEIDSEVKVIMQPNNSSESHRYVKIYPKVIKEIEDVSISSNSDGKVTDLGKSPTETNINDLTELESSTKSSSKEYPQPKIIVKVIDKSGALRTIIGEDKIRRTRRSVDSSSFDDVLKNINHTFEPAKSEIKIEKYPYYLLPDLNQDSPLRYAENFDRIPKKAEGELSFYEAADKYECPEIPQNIDPIPEHAKNAHLKKSEDDETQESEASEYEDDGEEEESVVDKKQPETPKGPRIQLGDKIDCLKIRYFGENPLDSPFFKEETVGSVKPIFRDLERTMLHKSPIKNIAAWRRSDENVVDTNEVFGWSENGEKKIVAEIDEPINSSTQATTIPEVKNESSGLSPSVNSTKKAVVAKNEVSKPVVYEVKPTVSPLVTLITTPRYTIPLKPKNIYDQIKLLDHLPEANSEDASKATNERIVDETTVNSKTEESSERDPKVLVEDIADPEAKAFRRRRIGPRRPVYQIFDVNKFLTTTPLNSAPPTMVPKKKVISEVYYKDEIKPSEQLNVFTDILNNIKNSSKIQNIPMQSASNFAEPSAVTMSTLEESSIAARVSTTPSIVRVKKFQSDSSYSSMANIDVPKTTLRPPAPTRKIPISYNGQKKFNVNQIPQRRQPNVVLHEFTSKQPQKYHYHSTSTSKPLRHGKPVQQPSTTTLPSKRKLLKRRRKPSSTTTTTIRTTTNILVPEQNIPNNHQPYVTNFIEETDEVVGLVPPQNFEYRTIVVENGEDRDGSQSHEEQSVPPKVLTIPVTEPTDEPASKKPLNKYLFPGLRPPMPQKVRPYSDYFVNGALVNEHLLRRRVAHVGNFRPKREAGRPSYADLSTNRGRQTAGLEESLASDDDADDYVPHRPKNYHYDEKAGKIVYHNKPKPKEEEVEEEVEYEEIIDTPGKYLERAEDATHPAPEKVTTKQLLATATPPPEGKGLLDFVLKLKNDPNYRVIPDPTTSKPGTIEVFSTLDPKSTDPPEFLNILSKVKSNSNYKYIEDPKENQSKKKSKTTTPLPEEELEEEEEEEEETFPRHIQNSPGGQAQNLGNIDIFDIGDYLPKIKAVVPKTVIDYSKYKTIQRSRPKTTPSTAEDDEEDVALGRRDEVLSKQDHSRETIQERFKPEVDREEESIDRVIVSEERAAPKLVIEKPTSTTQRIVQLRRGARPTTKRTTVEVFEPKEATSTARSVSRKRPISRGTKRPIVSSSTTEKVAKVYPANYSRDPMDHMQSTSFEKAKRVYRRRPVRIRPTTERQENDDKIVRRSVDNKFDYVKDEFEKASLEDNSNENQYEAIREEILSEHYPDEEFEDDDASETKLQETLQETPSDVGIVDESYDRSKKHGGNYKEATDEDDNIEDLEARGNAEKSMQAYNTYNQTKQQSHHKLNNVADTNAHQTTIASERKQIDVEVINQNYNKKQKHGGNYRAEKESETSNLKNKVEVINPDHDKQKKHAGNYKSQQDEPVVDDPPEKPDETSITIRRIDFHEDSHRADFPHTTQRRKIRIRKQPSSTTEYTLRLSDVVPKPDHFYSDPQLPKDVNKLMTEGAPLNLQSDEVSELAREGDDFEGRTEGPRRRRIKLRRRKLDLINGKSISGEELEPKEGVYVTKKPVFERDPSKRLYYYVNS